MPCYHGGIPYGNQDAWKVLHGEIILSLLDNTSSQHRCFQKSYGAIIEKLSLNPFFVTLYLDFNFSGPFIGKRASNIDGMSLLVEGSTTNQQKEEVKWYRFSELFKLREHDHVCVVWRDNVSHT